jgi:hypothetical protein
MSRASFRYCPLKQDITPSTSPSPIFSTGKKKYNSDKKYRCGDFYWLQRSKPAAGSVYLEAEESRRERGWHPQEKKETEAPWEA